MSHAHSQESHSEHPVNRIPLDFEKAIEGLLQLGPKEPDQADQAEEKKTEKRAKKK